MNLTFQSLLAIQGREPIYVCLKKLDNIDNTTLVDPERDYKEYDQIKLFNCNKEFDSDISKSNYIERLLLNLEPTVLTGYPEEPYGPLIVFKGEKELKAISEYCRGEFPLEGKILSSLKGYYNNLSSHLKSKVLHTRLTILQIEIINSNDFPGMTIEDCIRVLT